MEVLSVSIRWIRWISYLKTSKEFLKLFNLNEIMATTKSGQID